MLRKIVSAMARGRNGMALLPVAIGVAAVGLLVYPVLRWYFSMIQGTANLEDKLEMQIITQEYLGRINAATYDEIVQTAAAKGSSWTEDVRDGKYEARIEIGEDGKFADAKCDTEAVIGDGDKQCRTATITLTSKLDPAQVMNLSTISVATTGRIAEIRRRITEENERFNEYYTKTESDGQFACPWDYKMNAAGTKCEACNAPTWKQIRTGNCELFTCPTGQKANANYSACEPIICEEGKVLVGDNCKVVCNTEIKRVCGGANWRRGWGLCWHRTYYCSDGSWLFDNYTERHCGSWPFIHEIGCYYTGQVIFDYTSQYPKKT